MFKITYDTRSGFDLGLSLGAFYSPDAPWDLKLVGLYTFLKPSFGYVLIAGYKF